MSEWLYLLEHGSETDAWAVIRASATLSAIPETQFHAALEWLLGHGLVDRGAHGVRLSSALAAVQLRTRRSYVLEAVLRESEPAWLLVGDDVDPDDVPGELRDGADALSVSLEDSSRIARTAAGRIDLEERKAVGDIGEREVIKLLSEADVGDVEHTAAVRDGAGYDIAVTDGQAEWHLEVKATTKRARMVFFLSRNEWEVGRDDPAWRLVLVGLSAGREIETIGHLGSDALTALLPTDAIIMARWESVRVTASSGFAAAGLGFLSPGPDVLTDDTLAMLTIGRRTIASAQPDWLLMPSAE